MFLFLVACVKPIEPVRPKQLMSKDKVIDVLVDLQILEAHFQRVFKRQELYKDALDSSSISVFDAHGTNRIDFDSSFNYYAYYPDSLYLIYEAALDSVNFKLDAEN